MSKSSLLAFASVALLVAAALLLRGTGPAVEPPPALSLERAADGIEALARSFPPPGDTPLAWPGDHAAKPAQFAESWIFAGLVEAESGERHGFQLLINRFAAQQEAADRESAWAARDVYRARLVVEPARGEPVAEERLSRTALGLAGSDPDPPGIWVEDWRASIDGASDSDSAAVRLSAAMAGAGLDFRVETAGTAPVPVDADLYRGYWWPGLRVEGRLQIEGREVAVTGHAMMERLWGRGLPAGRGQLALARLWFDLGDGAAVRCEQLRRRAGGGTPLTECIRHPASPVEGITMTPADTSRPARTPSSYPSRWIVELPARGEVLRIEPLSFGASLPAAGAWSAIVVADEVPQRWGLLELSNFAPP
jgi:predicted secreted hydrolase